MSQNNRDLHSNINPIVALAWATVTDNTASTTSAIDTRDSRATEFVILTGSLADADATFAVTMTECDTSGGSYTAVDANDILGTLANASFIFSDDNKTFKVGYKGIKRYVKLTITPSNNSGSASYGVIAVQSPLLRPATSVPA